MPMFDENNCHNNHVCFSDKRKNRQKHRIFSLKSGQKAYIPKAGLAFYNVIPGLTEYKIYWMLKEEFKNTSIEIRLFPNIERDGDIEIREGRFRLLIDIKDYRKPKDLVFKINNEIESFLKVNLICIPTHRSKYSDYMTVLNDNTDFAKLNEYRTTPLKFVREADLIQTVYKWLTRIGGEKE